LRELLIHEDERKRQNMLQSISEVFFLLSTLTQITITYQTIIV